ncbi:MAG: porin family protein [Aestuariivirgaceae bacterium]
MMGKRIGAAALAWMSAIMVKGAAAADHGAPMVPEPAGIGEFYIRGDIGWSFLEWNGGADDSAASAGVGIGAIWNDVLRSDVRVEWSGNYEMTITDLDATTLLGNTYIDIPLDLTYPIKPYAGLGLGWGWVDDDGKGNDSGFTYSLMGGALFDMSEHWAIDTGYRFREIVIDGADFTDHSVTAGALFKF